MSQIPRNVPKMSRKLSQNRPKTVPEIDPKIVPKNVPPIVQIESYSFFSSLQPASIIPKNVSKLTQSSKWDKFIYIFLSFFLGGQADGHLGRRRSGVAVAQVRLLHEGHR